MSSRSPYRSSLAISTDVPTLSRSQTPTPFRPTDWRLGGSRHSHEDEMDDVAELLALPTSVLSMSRPSKTDPEQLQVLIEAHHQMDRVEKFLERRRMMTPARSTTPSCSLSHGLRSSQVPSFNHYGSLRSRYSMQRDSPQPLSTSIARPLSSLGTSGSPYGSGSSGYASLMKSSRGTSGSICSLDDDGGSSVSGFSLASEDWSGTPGGGSRSAYRSEYEEAKSAALTKNISEFLQRSDRALDRWRPGSVVPRSKPPAGRKQLGEVQADLAEEHSTCTMATERLENETAERMRLQQNSQELQSELEKVKRVNNQLEAEVSYSRAAAQINGDISPQDGDHLEDSGVYKLRYERAMRELEYMKSRLNSQHEQDMEKILTVKKQMERKVQDAVEEAEEQRQVVGQWKRKHGRLAGEAADLKHLLETQTGRNNLLEKKQRKFDHELQVAQDEIKSERRERERIQRERDTLNTEKFKLEQDYQSLKLELELKEERMRSLKKEIDDLSSSDKGQADINALKRNKHELELRCKEQEEELDDLAGQVQMLEQAKVRLEMSLEQMRKEQRKELQQRDEEMDDVRSSCQKKIKMMEVELEKEREDRTAVVRERHDLERKLNELTAAQLGTESVSVEKVNHLKRELKRTRALLKDAQLMLEREQKDAPSRVLIRQLRNQLEDAEFARTSALKAKQNVDLELQETSAQLEEITRTRNELDSKLVLVAREKAGLQSQLEEHEEEMSDVMKKYKAAVQQLSVDQLTLSDLSSQVSLLESEKNHLREQVAELSLRLETQSSDPTHVHETKRLEMRIKELESRLELEETTRQRLEGQINRLRETVEALSNEGEALRTKEQVAQEACRRAQRSLRDLQEDYASLQMRETEGDARRQEMELTTERLEAEVVTVRSDLKLALQRIQDLQSAMAEATDSSAEGEESDSDSDTSLDTFISSRGYNRKAPTIASSEGEGERDRSLRTEEESFSLLGNQQTESSA